MNFVDFRFPAVLRQLTRHLPAPLASAPLLLLLEVARRRALLVAPATLYGRSFRIVVEDLALTLCFHCDAGRFKSLPASSPADVTMTAKAVDFFQMASGMEDADSLFFRRRLRIEGDTELGVAVKYWIDASERPAWLSRCASRLASM
ncbi:MULTISPECIES: ubiquinone anaerobic biosynthesis accessory factor UbiT [unclassified Undibacterium]|uniref:ubiquinone anaerobic biosynthesis accessory factor UbiT n=1 Tax=unclassified Undibacterium TaxID=2630295 RepID=UPI002AC9A04B|nr:MULTISPECIES: SCP2 sterol-binding domain-containing protein [unclassified Undibacterium]MEB0138082.1 SCP2 sterol-binding domain-containing protein [Undibacterium sp. CCC2.1]MEB0171180.1 SCP2 sterol-binding domain-containing protein [Undibacterium sp. CCC1.1]MEB0175225.1 SCP2 sterol-binding domain-containing protein [Undibacterium sp. CCC3.4]MEB0214633.1 SCP2 sterol-binding domain-containing protein [Undibacterium sp. 5I2]WPX42401.1 SCP2 sterol-binding domain-containing protein [Undibacteriu